MQYLMEEMLPELEDLEKKGYFSRAEIKQIVKKRQDFEYHLKRRAALKKDFLRCAWGRVAAMQAWVPAMVRSGVWWPGVAPPRPAVSPPCSSWNTG